MTPTFIKSNAAAQLTMAVEVMDEQGTMNTRQIACERPLTVYLNWKEIVTLMTLGARPEALVLGYLKNQGFIEDIAAIESVIVDWESEAAAVVSSQQAADLDQALAKTVEWHRAWVSGANACDLVMSQIESYTSE